MSGTCMFAHSKQLSHTEQLIPLPGRHPVHYLTCCLLPVSQNISLWWCDQSMKWWEIILPCALFCPGFMIQP